MNNSNKQQSPFQPKKHFSRKKWLIISALIVVLFLGGIVSSWLFISHQAPSSSQNTKVPVVQTQVATATTKTTQTMSDADKLVYTGKASDAQAVYDGAIKTTEDPYQKSLLLLGKATTYFNIGQYDSALTNAKASEALNQNENIMQFIAQIYEKKNDNQNAISYYQKAIALADESQPSGPSTVQYYQGRIDALSGAKN